MKKKKKTASPKTAVKALLISSKSNAVRPHHPDFGRIARDEKSESTLNIQNPWKTLSTKVKYDNPWIRVTEHQIINPAGNPGLYGKVHYKNKAIGIIPLDEKRNTWLVGQNRYPLNEWSWEIPEGGGLMHDDPLESARRELKEETGLTAKKWTMIQRMHLSNSVSDEEALIFLAEGLKIGKHQREDSEADMKVWKLPFAEALKMVLDGRITDSLSVAGILKVGRMLNTTSH